MSELEYSTKKINELTAQAEAEDEDLLAIGNNTSGVLKKISVKNHAESIKNTIIGESEEIADIADGTVVGAIKKFNEEQGIITNEFSETETYAVGDVCIYDNKLYRFKEEKDAGEWDSEVVEETTVKKLLDQKNDLVSDAFDPTKSYSAGDYCIYNNTLYKFLEDKDAGEWDGDAELVQAVNVMSELNSALAYFEEIYSDDMTTSANSYDTADIPFTERNGYTAYLLSAISVPGISGQTNFGYVNTSFLSQSTGNFRVNGRNFASSAATYRIKIVVMFLKNA